MHHHIAVDGIGPRIRALCCRDGAADVAPFAQDIIPLHRHRGGVAPQEALRELRVPDEFVGVHRLVIVSAAAALVDVRGEDHVTNTAAQIQMFEAIGGKVPSFAHLPLLTGKEGKLSKRLGSLGVRELRAEGVEAMAICSFLAKLGTSEAIEPYYSLEELAQSLDFSKIGRSQPKFDEAELKHFNTRLVHNLPYAEVKSRYEISENFWQAIKGNIKIADDIKLWKSICQDELSPKIEDSELTNKGAELLPQEPWNEETFGTWIKALKEASGKNGKELYHPVRLALTGMDDGPELKVLLPLIGRLKAEKRLKGQKA